MRDTPPGAVELTEFGHGDGLRGVEGVKRHRSVVADALGRIWFSTDGGLSVIEPASVRKPEPVAARSCGGGGRRQCPGPPGSRPRPGRFAEDRLSLRRGHLSVPSDSDSAIASTASTTTGASRPRPGKPSTRTSPTVPTPFACARSAGRRLDRSGGDARSRRRARLLAKGLGEDSRERSSLGLALACVYRFRVGRVTRRLNVGFEERLSERLRIAQELHDTLLQGMMSASMQLHVVTRTASGRRVRTASPGTRAGADEAGDRGGAQRGPRAAVFAEATPAIWPSPSPGFRTRWLRDARPPCASSSRGRRDRCGRRFGTRFTGSAARRW